MGAKARFGGSDVKPLQSVRALVFYGQGAIKMHVSSPFVVVPVIVLVFFACILWATGGKADGSTADDGHPAH